MSANLNSLFIRGITRAVYVKGDTLVDTRPPQGKHWLILGGQVTHSGATGIVVQIVNKEAQSPTLQPIAMLYNKTAAGAVSNSLFNTKAEDAQAQWSPMILDENMAIRFTAASSEKLYFEVLEW